MNASQLYADGKLDQAILVMNDEVRARPTDTDARGFLVELLCIAGNLERADVQLDALSRQDKKAEIWIAMIRQLIRAEQWRQQFFVEGRLPEFLEQPSPRLQLQLKASIAMREGKGAEAHQLLAEAEDLRPHVSGTCAGIPFDDLRDLDDLVAGVLELLTSTGKYYWVPLERVDKIEFKSPVRPRDILWRRATVAVRDGPEGDVFVPSIYAPWVTEQDALERLGRTSNWIGGDAAPVRGRGLRTYLVGEESRTILELSEIELTRSAT